jgi:hypothetical protein
LLEHRGNGSRKGDRNEKQGGCSSASSGDGRKLGRGLPNSWALPWSRGGNFNFTEKNMKSILILLAMVFGAGCNSGTNMSGESGTSMAGTWTVSGTLGSQGGSVSYQVQLVSSPCSVTTPVGSFSVVGPVCFIANNNSGQGSITGGSTSPKSAGQGVLVGVAANPVPDEGAFNLLFVAGDANGNVVEFAGSGTVNSGALKGSGTCSASTPICQSLSATFSGTRQ